MSAPLSERFIELGEELVVLACDRFKAETGLNATKAELDYRCESIDVEHYAGRFPLDLKNQIDIRKTYKFSELDKGE